MSRKSGAYERYIGTLDWWLVSRSALERAGFQCEHTVAVYDRESGQYRPERCPAVSELQVHHRTYARLGHEGPGDLIVLCRRHHTLHDERRRSDIERQRYDRRLDAWARRRYGDDWRECFEIDDLVEEFEAFVSRQEHDG